jgi:hypothetical protein
MDDADRPAEPLPASHDSQPDPTRPDPDPADAVATGGPDADAAATDDPPQVGMADGPGPAPHAALPDPIPHAGIRYALLRLLMLVAVGGILYVIGLRGWLLAFAAVLVSGIVSLFMFMRQRNDAAVNLEHTVDHWKHRRDQEDGGLAPE